MKKFIIIFFLSFNFIAQADDIKDFQIEGLSIGDSMLKYLNEKEIKASKRNYFNILSPMLIPSIRKSLISSA